MASPDLKVIALSGSLRAASYNTAALRAAQEVAPDGMSIEIAAIADIPFYNGDVQAAGIPGTVMALAEQLRAADALLICSPEYNYSISGVLKNTIDWLSRTPIQPFAGKPVAVMSASMSLLGGPRAQYDLRRAFVFLDALPINKPEVFIAQAQLKFDDQGRLTDEPTRGFIRQLLEALATWTRRLQGAS